MPSYPAFDYLLIGGGLSNALIAMAVLRQKPSARVALVEREAALGGNHLWCFHGFDLSEAGQALVEPLVVQRWSGYSVRFPELERRLQTPYAAVSSERLAEHVAAVFASHGNARLLLAMVTPAARPSAASSSGL